MSNKGRAWGGPPCFYRTRMWVAMSVGHLGEDAFELFIGGSEPLLAQV